MGRILVWLFTVLFLASIHFAEAQQPAKIGRIGFLALTSGATTQFEAFRQGLRELGYLFGYLYGGQEHQH
jgi:hypothetical protein